MRSVHVLPRTYWITRALGPDARLTEHTCERAFAQLSKRNWFSAAAPFGLAWERIAFANTGLRGVLVKPFIRIPATQPREQWFHVGFVEGFLGGPLDIRFTAVELAQFGLAIAAFADGRVLLRPTDVRAARYINLARCGRMLGKVTVQGLISGFLMLGNPARRGVRVTAERRLAAGIAMEEWGIDCPEILDSTQRVAIHSRWHLPHASSVRTTSAPGTPTPTPRDGPLTPGLASAATPPAMPLRRTGTDQRCVVEEL